MMKDWVQPVLSAMGLAAGAFLAVNRWVYARKAVEAKLWTTIHSLTDDLAALMIRVEAGQSIGERSKEITYTVQALTITVADVRVILERALLRDDRMQERMNELKEQVARVEEHLRSTDRELIGLAKNVEALRVWVSSLKQSA